MDSSFTEKPCVSPASTESSTVTSGPPTTLTTSTTATSVKLSDLESTLEASFDLFNKSEMDTARSVPDIDLSNSLYAAQDWEPLYTSANLDLEPLCTPVVTCTPTCTSYTSSFVFSYPESDTSVCGQLRRHESSSNEQSSDSLNSPTLLTLWGRQYLFTSIVLIATLTFKTLSIAGLQTSLSNHLLLLWLWFFIFYLYSCIWMSLLNM